MSKLRQSEWANVIEAQTIANQQREFEEQQALIASKRLIKETLDAQIREKQLRQQQERTQNLQSEMEQNRKQAEAMHIYRQQLQQQNQAIQQYYAKSYEQLASERQADLYKQKQAELQHDIQVIQRSKQQLEMERKQREQMRRMQAEHERFDMELRNQNRERERQNQMYEKYMEGQDARMRDQKINERIAMHNQFYQKLSNEIDQKNVVYSPVIQNYNEKQQKWFETEQKWKQQFDQRQQESERRRLSQQIHQKQDTINTLQTQLQEKDRNKHNQALTKYQESLEVAGQIERMKKWDSDMRNMKQVQKQQYANELQYQVEERQRLKDQEYKMDPKELQVNRGLLSSIQNKSSVEFKAVPGVHAEASPLKQILPKEDLAIRQLKGMITPNIDRSRSFAESQPRRLGSQPNSPIYARSNEQKLNNSFDPFRHDPIVNPIGATIPRPIGNQIYGKGRGLSLLYAGNSISNLYKQLI